MQRLLITGGTGYLGSELVRQALTRDMLVVATYHNTIPPQHGELASAVHWLPLDICNEQAVCEGVNMVCPDVIIHTAFQQHEPHMWDVNVKGTHTIAQAAYQHHVRLIHLSSDVVFDGDYCGFYTEQHHPMPINAYGSSKARAEQIVNIICPHAIIVRTSLIYGFEPIDRHTQFILDIADGKQHAQLFVDEYRCPIFVSDLAHALLELTTSNYSGYIHIAGSDCINRYEFGRLVAKAYGRDVSAIVGGKSSQSAFPRPRNCALDSRVAQQLLTTPLRGVYDVFATYLPHHHHQP